MTEDERRDRSRRLFVGVPIPEAVAALLASVTAPFATSGLAARWERSESMHITLHFIGATADALLEPIANAMARAADGVAAHAVSLASVGAFPTLERPSVIWAGLAGETGALAALQERVAAALDPLGIPRETRPFHPHVTIGRVRRVARSSEQRAVGAAVSRLTLPTGV